MVNGAWHPKAVTFREGAFSPKERQADSYGVTITAPEKEVIAVSGRLIAETLLPGGMKELRFRAENLTNFGLAGSPDLRLTTRQANGVEIRSYYFAAGEKWGPKLADYAARIIPFYQKLFGFYPQDTLAILPGSKRSTGGSPPASNIVVVHDTLDEAGGEPFAEWITAHEIGHQYWGWDCVIDSGAYYHWPGIPLGIYTDRLYTEAHNPKGASRHRGFIDTPARNCD